MATQNKAPKQEAAPKNDADVAVKKVGKLSVQTNMTVVDNTHEPSDTKPRTAEKAIKGKVAGFDKVDYL